MKLECKGHSRPETKSNRKITMKMMNDFNHNRISCCNYFRVCSHFLTVIESGLLLLKREKRNSVDDAVTDTNKTSFTINTHPSKQAGQTAEGTPLDDNQFHFKRLRR